MAITCVKLESPVATASPAGLAAVLVAVAWSPAPPEVFHRFLWMPQVALPLRDCAVMTRMHLMAPPLCLAVLALDDGLPDRGEVVVVSTGAAVAPLPLLSVAVAVAGEASLLLLRRQQHVAASLRGCC